MAPRQTSVIEITRKAEEYGDIRFPHWSSLILWTIGVVIMLGLTVKYVCPIYNNYYDEEENVAVKIGMDNNFDESHLPDIYVCVPAVHSKFTPSLLKTLRNGNGSCTTSDCELYRKLEEHSWNVWKDVNFSRASTVTEFNRLFIDKLFSNMTNFRFEVDGDNSKKARGHWQLIIYEQIFQFFHSIFYTDLDFFDKDKRSDEITMEYDTFFVKQAWNEQSQLRDDREIDQLFRKVAEFFCQFFTWGVVSDIEGDQTYKNKVTNCTNYLQRTGSIVSPYGMLFCSKLPAYSSRGLKSHGHTHGVSSNASYYDVLRDRRISLFSLVSLTTISPILNGGDPNKVSLSFQYQTQDFAMFNKQEYKAFENVNIKYTLQSRIYEQRKEIVKKCYEEKSAADCLPRCMAQKIVSECRCIPFTFRSMFEKGNTPYCNERIYDACRKEAYARFGECNVECKYACQQDILQWQVTSHPVGDNETRVSLSIAPVTGPYLRFNVTNRDGIEDLISQIGGLFNFYLGWSGLTLIFVFVNIWDCYRRWRKRSSGSGNESASAGLRRVTTQWMWLTGSSNASASSSKIESLQEQVNDLSRRQEEMEKERKALVTSFKNAMSQTKRLRSLS